MAEKFWADDTRGFPCKDCQERHLACHQYCERYKKAQREHLDRKRKKADAKGMERVWFSVRIKNYAQKSRSVYVRQEDKEV